MAVNDVDDELDALRLRGEKVQLENAARGREILDLLEVPDVGAVTVRYDAEGLLSAIDIDAEAGQGLSADDLVREINLALLRGDPRADAASSPASDLDAQRARNSTLAGQIGAVVAPGTATEPQKISNDFGTVTVTAMLGSVGAVECSTHWIDSTSHRLVSEEIVRVARIAAKQTDAMGRFS